MGGSCERGSCECETESCSSSSCGSEGACQACGTKCGGDPVECGSAMWGKAFFEAMHQLHVEILKTKMQKAWGSKMEKAADIILEAAGVKWQSMMAQAKAKAEVREKLQRLWQESK